MSLKKTVAIAAAVGALAAISVPAMALENEFHGFYTIKGFVSNFNNGAAADLSPAALRKNERANNYAEQRARIFYTGKASDDLKLVTAFEMDTRFGGITNGKYTNTSDGGVLDGDGVNLETKWAYLDFNATKNFNVKTGLLPYKDSLKGLFIDADIPAISTKVTFAPLTIGLAYTRYNEANQTNSGFSAGHLGDRSTDLLLSDASFAISKDVKVGGSYYLLINNNTASARQPSQLHILGANAEAKVGPLTVSGFGALQMGHQKNSTVTGVAASTNTNFHGYALNALVKAAVGPGTAKVGGLWVSGDEGSDNHQNAWLGSGVQSYNDSGLMLLVRNNAQSGTTTSNEFVRRTISNVILAHAGYDAKIGPKAYLNGNVGMAWSAKNTGSAIDRGTNRRNATNYIGTEIALEGGYKVYDNLTASAQAAYLITGGAFNGSAADSSAADVKDPENPYTARLVLTYAF